MECYKCGSSKELSLKKMQGDKMIFICRSCRRKDYKRLKAREALNTEILPFNPEAWYQRYLINHQRLINHPYAVKNISTIV